MPVYEFTPVFPEYWKGDKIKRKWSKDGKSFVEVEESLSAAVGYAKAMIATKIQMTTFKSGGSTYVIPDQLQISHLGLWVRKKGL